MVQGVLIWTFATKFEDGLKKTKEYSEECLNEYHI
jgi:hypothetical protein